MQFLPLDYAISTFTNWHILVGSILIGLPLLFSNDRAFVGMLSTLITQAIVVAVFYCWMATIIGQVFGDRFTWSQIWPSGFALATAFMIGAIIHFMRSTGEKLVVLALIPIGIPFFGFFISATMWAMPKVVSWTPKASWGAAL
ncbi:hypothetical protein [Qipengyuania vesicularis]|uniref:hypothetical protein n=1 Tax=Qipengyuania vesicularis TaxID=2867232 RepID=UPI001C88DEAD|nr:hypothetical protein [Qipengyuania vesicularis]MBX7528617.1 hypothetical protein [Qipengyuania vesicularis]